MTDVHCHLLPYVDDGAHDLEEAAELLKLEAAQGVTTVCVTPHLRQEMFETPDEILRRQYERLSKIAEGFGITLCLSREYHYDGLFREKLHQHQILPIGRNGVLVEFSYSDSRDQMLCAMGEILNSGYVPIIAHVERYAATTPDLISDLKNAGARIQVNADAVLGRDGRYAKKLAWTLLRADLVDVVASDAHDTAERPPRLAQCYKKLIKKLGAETASRLTERNPEMLLTGKTEG